MIALEGADASPARLAEIEALYVERTTTGTKTQRAYWRSRVTEIRDLLAMIYQAGWHKVRDGLPPLVNGQKPNVDIMAVSSDGKIAGRWFGVLHWHDPPQIGAADGKTYTVNNGETYWRPL